MNYKKKYKEALENARQEYNTTENVERKQWLEELFPELKESEDERIRKELIKETKGSEVRLFETVTNDEFVTWLERQGEQKPTDEEMKTILRTEYEKGKADTITEMQKPAWSEEDMSKVQRVCKYLNEAKKYYADITEVRECIDWLKSLKDRVQPQSKQEWSEEDKDYYDTIIRKLEVTQDDAALTDNQMNFLKSLKNRVQSKQEWSEEDEWKFSDIMALLRGGENCHYNTPELFEWFKSIKERVQPQPKYEWSEEDEVKLKSTCALIRNTSLNGNEGVVDSTIIWLESLKDRVQPKHILHRTHNF